MKILQAALYGVNHFFPITGECSWDLPESATIIPFVRLFLRCAKEEVFWFDHFSMKYPQVE
jgi:hypothetical protein